MSGLHAALAGVLTALFVAARVKIVPGALPQVIRLGAGHIEAQAPDNEPDAMDPDRVAIAGAVGRSLDAATAPLQRFEHGVQLWVTYAILPVFGLFNAGVVTDATVLGALPTAVPLGIMVGLVLNRFDCRLLCLPTSNICSRHKVGETRGQRDARRHRQQMAVKNPPRRAAS